MTSKRLIVATITLIAMLTTTSAHAETAVDRALDERRATVDRARDLRRQLNGTGENLRWQIGRANDVLSAGPGRGLASHPERWAKIRQTNEEALRATRSRLRGLEGWVMRRIEKLRTRYAQLDGWLATVGVFRTCPVPDHTAIVDNFGRMVRLPDVPVHRHMGNDIPAPTGAPIIASFDGYATTSWGKLGGLEVRLSGPDGYVYHAHLSRVGQLGAVRAGAVIGYVGSTGDATGPHDHLEWHPGNGGAVDPQPLLVAACVSL